MYRHTRLDRLLHTLSEALHSVIVSHVLPQSTPVRPALKESEVSAQEGGGVTVSGGA